MSATLFNRLCNESVLFKAWQQIKSKGSSGGIDGETLENFEEHLSENLKELLLNLKNKNWIPEPYLSISIPKKSGETRRLGLLSIKDKIVQQCIRMLIEPRFEKMFVANSYGYRKNKGHNKAVRFALNCLKTKGVTRILKMDIDNYFDTINHDLLFKRISPVIGDSEIIRLVSLCVKMGVVSKNMKWNEVVEGVPQGAILSPLLSNFYLHSFDQFILTRTKLYVRYADDFIIFCNSQDEAEKLVKECTAFLGNRLKLKLNAPQIIDANDGFEFLGIFFKNKSLGLTEEKFDNLASRIKDLSWSIKSFDSNGLAALRTINSFYSKLVPQSVLEKLDDVLIERIKDIAREKYSLVKSRKLLLTALRDVQFFSEKRNIEKNIIFDDIVSCFSLAKISDRSDSITGHNKKLIQKKKREYHKKENEMSELIVDSYGTFLGYGKNGLNIKMFGQKKHSPATANLKHITILSSGVTLSSSLIAHCCKNDIPIDFFSVSGGHYGSLLSNSYFRTSLWAKQMYMSDKNVIYLAEKIIIGKIKNQINLIKYFNKYHGESSGIISSKCDETVISMQELLKKLRDLNVCKDDYRQKFMGVESAAAILYWDYIRVLLADDNINFVSRERQGATDLFNSLLNYGYGILYARIWQFVLKYQMNPTLGILHLPQGSKPILVYDIIELFRSQCVDRVVISLVQKGEPLEVKDGMLSDVTRKLLVKNIAERFNRYEVYRGKELKFLDIIKLQIKAVCDYIDGGKSFKPYVAKW